MRRADLLDDDRAEDTFAWVRDHGKAVTTLKAERSNGHRTERAVQQFHELDAEIRAKNGEVASLDDLVSGLMPEGKTGVEQLRAEAKKMLGADSKVLATPLLD